MRIELIRRLATPVALTGALLLVGDLFLGWHREEIAVAGVVGVHATSAGWSGWGAGAGVLAVALVVWLGREAASERSAVGSALVGAVLAVGALGFAAAEALTASATIEAGSAASIETGVRLWPAYAGLALAAIVAVAMLVRLAAELPPAGTRATRPHAA